MRKLIFACVAAALVIAPIASIVKAEDTTVIKRDSEGDKTVIKKRDELNVLPVALGLAFNLGGPRLCINLPPENLSVWTGRVLQARCDVRCRAGQAAPDKGVGTSSSH